MMKRRIIALSACIVFSWTITPLRSDEVEPRPQPSAARLPSWARQAQEEIRRLAVHTNWPQQLQDSAVAPEPRLGAPRAHRRGRGVGDWTSEVPSAPRMPIVRDEGPLETGVLAGVDPELIEVSN